MYPKLTATAVFIAASLLVVVISGASLELELIYISTLCFAFLVPSLIAQSKTGKIKAVIWFIWYIVGMLYFEILTSNAIVKLELFDAWAFIAAMVFLGTVSLHGLVHLINNKLSYNKALLRKICSLALPNSRRARR
ncbi:MAG: hypothetical protein GY781_04780 [Gammaproteobacteria bacterium]|nr:hypothetical protein [Gammaproteobacteria bacterium]